MPQREVKKTKIIYEDQVKEEQRQRERSRQKVKVQVIDNRNRQARLAALKNKRREQEEKQMREEVLKVQVKVQENNIIPSQNQEVYDEKRQKCQKNQENGQNEIEDDEGGEGEEKKILLKPIFIHKQDRNNEEQVQTYREAERKKKALKYTTKLLLKQNREMAENSDDEQIGVESDEQNRTDIPNDEDDKNEEYEYELWKVRELKRIRRDREERQKLQIEKAQLERRRKMNNEQILLQNKVMGSDATENAVETKYVYMQQYYHKGAFYQDSNDPIFKRDYNLPTPLQMQDKSGLPQILQKRKGKFGSKGQSKYKHLTAEDTTNFDPQFRQDQSIMAGWKKKMAGYKGSGSSNI